MRKITIALAAIAVFLTAGTALALPKSMRDYSARKLYFTSGTGSIVLKANDTTSLIIGDSANSAIMTFDTGTGTETVKLSGTIGEDVLHIDVGTVQVDEGLVVGGTFGLTGDLTLSGGAGALTFDGSASSIVIDDDDPTALLLGSAGALNILTIDTTDDQETLIVIGYAGADSFHVDVGTMQVDENADFGAGIDVTGAVTVSTTSDLNGDIAAGGAAGALTFDAAASSVVYTDASGTGLLFGSDGHLNLLTLDSTNDQETLIVTGENGVDAFHVDVGTSLFDEATVFGASVEVTTTTDQNGDLSVGGGAGAVTFDAVGSSVVYTDATGTGLLFGSTGHLNLLTLDSTDNQETLIVTGETAVDAFHVDVGTSLFDEAVVLGASLEVTTTTDQNGDLSAGGGAGALTFDAASSSVVYTDASGTGLLFGSDGHLNLLTLDSTNDQETLIVTGETGVDAFHVDVGTSLFDEATVFGASIEVTTTADMNGDISAGGGAGAVTFDAASSSVVYTDASGTGLVFGSDGHLNLLTLDSTNDQETLIVTGETGVDAFHVDVGTSLFDEATVFGASIQVTTTSDLNGVISAGGGAGAITFDGATGTNTILVEDAVGSGLAIGSTGHTDILRFVSTDDGEGVVVTGHTGVLSLHNDMGLTQLDQAVTMGATLGVTGVTTTTGGLTSITGVNTINDITPSATDIDFTAEHQVAFFAKTTGAIMTEIDTEEDYFRIGPLSTYFEVFQDGNNTDFIGSWGDGVTGWVMPGPNAADQGFQLTEGILLGSAHSFTGQTDTMTMRVAFLISTRAELDVLQAGFRKLEAYAVGDDEAEWTTAYDDKVTVGIYANAGVLEQSTSFATSDVVTTCTHAAAANGDILALQIVVDAAGDTTVSIGTDTPAGGTAVQTRTSVTAAYADLTADTNCNVNSITLTATEYVPTIALAKAAGGVSTTTIVDYYVGP